MPSRKIGVHSSQHLFNIDEMLTAGSAFSSLALPAFIPSSISFESCINGSDLSTSLLD
ncbi:hypothetical protein HPTD01_1447 [Halomonas sp. TD01]|nr:hypothetical protein HPTD01_1447 [Halomonas sp. TD01]